MMFVGDQVGDDGGGCSSPHLCDVFDFHRPRHLFQRNLSPPGEGLAPCDSTTTREKSHSVSSAGLPRTITSRGFDRTVLFPMF